jgi:hypothetical protein
MVIHSVVALSNHMHYLISPESTEQQALFFAFVNANIAKEVKLLIDPKRKIGHFWGRRYEAIVATDEEACQLARLKYQLSQGVKEHLVEKATQWPGVHAARALLGEEELKGIWFDRTGLYKARRRRKPGAPEIDEKDFKLEQTVTLTPLPCLAHLTEGQRKQVVQEMLGVVEREAKQDREERGIAVVGAQTVQQQNIHMRPAQSKKSPAPAFHAATREAYLQLRDAYRAFTVAFYEAAEKLRKGDPSARFPPGSFPPGLPSVPMAV